MKSLLLLAICAVSLGAQTSKLPHLELEMNGPEYESLLRIRGVDEGDSDFDPIIKMGRRFFDWMQVINAERPENQKLSLSSPQNQPGYPIDTPRVSSPKIIEEVFTKLKTELPEVLKKAVLGNGTLLSTPGMSDEEFIAWGLKINDLYARASRWILQEPMLWAYAARKQDDVRGYYYLNQVPQLEEKLKGWKSLSAESQNQYMGWLEGICLNSGESSSECQGELKSVINKESSPLSYYHRYLKHGKDKWDQLFEITSYRSDVEWNSSAADILNMPFVRPESQDIKDFLQLNIQDEWKWENWGLKLNFVESGYDTAHVEFIPGATPHVNGLAGSTITMDANQPISEYTVRWTIRHEFGHVLGFPDCYVEFYDTSLQQMISYQIDTTNLMCSRRGKLQAKHFDELKRVYFK